MSDSDLYNVPKSEERKSECLRGEGDRINFIDLRFGRGQVVGLGKRWTCHKLNALGINNDFGIEIMDKVMKLRKGVSDLSL